MPIFFDTHAHLDYPEYEKDFSEVLARAQNAGITKIISIGTSLDSSRRAIALAEKLMAQDRNAEALEDYRALIAEAPDYPGRKAIDEKLQALEHKIAAEKKND